ncbi:cardiolipin synthase [Macrococcus hajekii]|nr:cardiolipin synthase [Macrococcus hajekii]GGB12547.1 cardiolipin synthase [Macrococcus hajekii]
MSDLLTQELSDIYALAIFIGFIVNIFLAFIIIFLERRAASSTWAWLFVLFFLPLLGFFLYLLFGKQINRENLFRFNEEDKHELEVVINEQIEALDNNLLISPSKEVTQHKDLIRMLLINQPAFLTTDNHVDVLTDGQDKFTRLIDDILAAKEHIHIQYYIFKRDGIGQRIIDALEVKLKEGVEVRMLYDDMGSRTLTLSKFKAFKAMGGQVEAFFPSFFPLINFRLNNRNHRKIVVIDGIIGYIGGFNVGDEYLGLDDKFGYWRDTHLRIEGDAVNALQLRFILDWNSQATRNYLRYEPKYFPDVKSGGNIGIQIASSGPDEELHQIKYGYIKMISSAKKSIYIQSPYFIPDAAFLDALKIAVLSGVKVYLMIPNKPDHPFVYWGTTTFASELLKVGAKVFLYEEGFIHTKMMMIDDEVASVGTANMDVRSFELNFEVNAFIYDQSIAVKLRQAFEDDVSLSSELTLELYEQRALWIKVKEAFARLISPIL